MKRIISLLLALTMLIGMVPMFAVTADAATTNNPYHKDGALCYMLPYAYNAMQWSSADYYIAHYNIKHVYNYQHLKNSIERGFPQAIEDALSDPASTITAVVNEAVTFDGEITEQDLYDYMLSYMLIENATTPDPYQTKSIQDALSATGAMVDFFDRIKGISKLSDARNCAERLKAAYPKAWSKLFGNWNLNSVSNFLLVMSAVCDVVDEHNQLMALTEDYYTIFAKLGGDDSAETALTLMWDNTEDPLLKVSISKFYDLVISDDYSNYLAAKMMEKIYSSQEAAMNVTTAVFRSMLIGVSLECIKNTVAQSFVAGLFIGYGVADLIYAISDFKECVYEIRLYDTINSSILGAVRDLESVCKNNQGKQTSVVFTKAYIFAMQMAWRLQVKELEKCKYFLERGKEKGWFWDNSTIEDTVERIEANILSVDKTIPSKFINNALDQYSHDIDLIGAGYKITYNLNGGKWNSTNGNKKYNEPYTIPNEAPTKDGFTFTVWQLGDDSYYSPGYELEPSLNPCWCSRELVFTACWTDQDTITYNANGGTGAPNSQENTEGNTTLSTKIPTRKGYTFLGWDENKSAKTPTYKYEAGKTMVLTKDGDVTLYAIWQKNPVIIYNANGGSSAPASHENKGVLSKTWPEWTGHTFMGWSVKKTYENGDTLYGPGKTIDLTGDITLYAIWNTDPYVVKYDYNDGSPLADRIDEVVVPEANWSSYKIADTRKNSDAFKGWMYQTSNGEYWWTNGVWDNGKVSVVQSGQTMKLTGNLVLYAKWDYFVHYHSNGTVSHEVVRDGTNYVIDAPVSTENGQVFKYWKSVDATGKETRYYVGDTIDLTADLSLSAVWGTTTGADTTLTVVTDQLSYEPGDTVKLRVTADNSGYFRVDASENNGFKLKDANGGKASKAVFVENKSNSEADDLKCYNNGSAYTVELYIPNSCADASYPVKITASNGTYSEATDGSVSGTETSTVSETVMIKIDTSVEEANSYTLSYHPNNGYGGAPDAVRFKEDDNVKIAGQGSLVRAGYKFGGWSANENGTGKTYEPGKSYKFAKDMILYAIWEVDPTYDMPEELEMTVIDEKYRSKTGVSWHKPGDIIGLRIEIDNSDHLHVDVRNCSGFTFTSRDGYETKEGTFYEESSPDCKGKTTYKDGSAFYVSIKIPESCRDGEYTIIVKGADGRVDPTTGQSYSKILEVGYTITVRASEAPDEIHLNKTELTLHKGGSKRLDATMLPEYVSEGYHSYAQSKPYVTWKASNSSVVEVDDSGNDARVRGKTTGTATVTAKFMGVSASCKVTVVNCDYSGKIVDAEYLASPATCKEQATYYYVCSCGNAGSKTYKAGTLKSHSYSAWTIVIEPGEYSAGLKERTCSGCGDVESETIPATGHTHTFSAEWSRDAANHWHAAICEHTNEVSEFGTHVYSDDADTICNTCGYERTVEQPDDPGHIVCVFDQEVIKAAALKSPADCDDPAVYYKSCTCGAISTTETFTYGTANGHSPSAWQTGETDHWKVCTVCTEEIANSRGTHADTDSDNACDTCGYDMTPAQPDDPEHTVHVYDREVIKAEALKSAADCDDPAVYYMSCECGEVGTVETFTYGTPNGHTPSGWQNNDDEHWKCCLICSDVIVDTKGSHADNIGDDRCDVCGYRMGGNGQHYWPSYNFPVLPTMPVQMPFTDVYRSDWFYDDVQNAWENDLIDGVTATSFRPYETLTVAQAIKLAAALHQLDNMGYVTLSNGYTNWYDTYVDYAVENGIIENKYASYTAAQMNAPISRNEFVHIFYGAMSYYSQWNSVDDNAIPDVKLGDKYASEIYTFYRAGILTGNDAAGTFAPNSSIKRSEVAAILSRMYDESCRQSITLN